MRILQEQKGTKGTIIGTYTGNGKVTESYRSITQNICAWKHDKHHVELLKITTSICNS